MRSMLDIFSHKLIDGLEISNVKEKPTKYIVDVVYKKFEPPYMGARVELLKAVPPAEYENHAWQAVCLAMLQIWVSKGNYQKAVEWKEKMFGKDGE